MIRFIIAILCCKHLITIKNKKMRNFKKLLVITLCVFTSNLFGQVRPDIITNFTPAQRTTLVNLMQQFITKDVI